MSIVIMKEKNSALEMLCAAFDAEPGNVGAAVRLMQHYGELGRYKEALDICNRSLECGEQDFSLLLEYGNLCFKNGDVKGASDTFSKLTELDPGRIEGWNNLGILQLRSTDIEGARRSFGQVIKIKPDHHGALLNLGNYHYLKGEFVEAQSFFARLLECKPDFPDAWFNLGNTLVAQGNFLQARSAFLKALEYRGRFFSAYKNLGFVYEKLNNIEKAQECYSQAVEINKADYGIHINLGSVYFQQKNYTSAKKCFLKAVRLVPNAVSGWIGLGRVSLARGDFNTYIRSMMTIIPRLGDEELARSIEVLIEMNQLPKAGEILAQADRLGRGGDYLDSQRLIIYLHKGINKHKVTVIFKRLSALPRLSDPVRKGLARFSLEKADYDATIKFIKQMAFPDKISYGILWRALLGKKQTGLVKQLIHSYLREDPDCFDCWFIMARIEAERENRLQAEKYLIKALENGFTNVDELNDSPKLRQIFDSLAFMKTNCRGSIDKA